MKKKWRPPLVSTIDGLSLALVCYEKFERIETSQFLLDVLIK